MQMNFTTSLDDVRRYTSAGDLQSFYRRYGLDGLEVMPLPCVDGETWEGPECCSVLTPDMVIGVHTCSIGDWMGLDREVLLEYYRKDLRYARKMGVGYVVFYVTQESERESWIYEMQHRDEEVIDASCELNNELLDGEEYPFWFLMENLWWPGLTFRSPKLTGQLLEGVHYEKRTDAGRLWNGFSFLYGTWEYIIRSREEHAAYLERGLFSAGQKAVANIALILALRKIAVAKLAEQNKN